MKKYLALLLALVLAVCTGCGSPVPQAQAAEQTGSYDLFEENAVDDSQTFRWYWEPGKKELPRYVQEDLLPQYVDTWFENGKLLDADIQDTLNEALTGWVLIEGTPKQDMGWNAIQKAGKTLYCRRILIRHLPHSQNYQLEKTTAAADLRAPEPVNHIDNSIQYVTDTGLQLPKIKSAELYVNSLQACFVLKDPQKLELLKKGLELPAQVRRQTFQAGHVCQDGTGNPLILDLEGQGRRMVLTDTQGRAATDIWGGHLMLMPMSIFELFQVPLEAKGYSHDQKGNTQVVIRQKEAVSELEYEFLCTLDPRGNLIRFEDQTPYHGRDPESRNNVEYTYNEKDQVIGTAWGDRGYRDEKDLEYNSKGLLVRETHRFGDQTETFVYEYDDQNRLVAKIGVTASGEEIPEYSAYVWYDGEGMAHRYWYRSSGEAMGDPPEKPVRRPKK